MSNEGRETIDQKPIAKEYLLQIRRCDLAIQNKIDMIQVLRDEANRITSAPADGIAVKTSKRVDRREAIICEYLTLEQELENEIMAFTKLRLEVIAMLENLTPVYNRVLYQVYVLGKTLQEVADDAGMSYSWATTTQGRALKALQVLLDEKNPGTENMIKPDI